MESLTRYAAIAHLFWKYREAGIFTVGESDLSFLGDTVAESEIPSGTPAELVADLNALGPVFVKLGQSMSTRPDLVAAPFLDALSEMQDDCPPVDFDEVRGVVEEQLGGNLNKIFPTFDAEPLASASLGQVHWALLRDGTEVAVKVQRPGVTEIIKSDIQVLRSIAEKADKHSSLGKQLGLSQWVAELEHSLLRELDYVAEAGNLETLNGIAEQYDELRVPLPVRDLSSVKVLTMEYVPGVKAGDIPEVRRLENTFSGLAEPLVQSYLDQLFIHGFVHVDPHPGNILLTNDGELVILDLGMVTFLSPGMRQRLLALVLAIVEDRGEEAAERAIDMGEEMEGFDRASLVRVVSDLVSAYTKDHSQPSEGLLLLNLTGAASQHGLRPPPEVILLGKTLLNLEFLLKTIAPTLSVRDLVRSHLPKILTHRTLDSLGPVSMITKMLEVQEISREAPKQIFGLLKSLARNEFRLKVDAIDETRFTESFQKIANRVSVSLIVSSLIVGAAMMMRVETAITIWGYPALAFVMFSTAGLLGFGLVIAILWNDRR